MKHIATQRAVANSLLASALLFCFASFPPQLRAQRPTGAGTPKSPPAEHPADKSTPSNSAAAPSQFAWLAGRWVGQWGPRMAQQVWMPPQSGLMVGVFQLTENNKTLVVELYTIASTPRGVELRIRRFTPSLTAWEKSSPVVLTLQNTGSKSILFENSENGQPKVWEMIRTNADSFVTRFKIVPKNGEHQVAEIVYHREPISAPASH